MDLQYQYLVAKLQEALARDPRVGTQDIRVVYTNGRIHLMGEVSTAARRAAVDAVAADTIPGIPLRNEVRVIALGDAGDAEAIG